MVSDEAEGFNQNPHLGGLLIVDSLRARLETRSAEAYAGRAPSHQDVFHQRQGVQDFKQATLDEEQDTAYEATLVGPGAEEDAIAAPLLEEELPAAIVALEEECDRLAWELLPKLEQVQGMPEAIHSGEKVQHENGAVFPTSEVIGHGRPEADGEEARHWWTAWNQEAERAA